jgi:heat shock protein HslJ
VYGAGVRRLLLVLASIAAGCTGQSPDGDWRATAATVDGVEVAGLDEVVVTMEIDGDRITGSSGCNEYDAPAEIDDSTITFGEGAATERGCEGRQGEIEALFYGLTGGSAEWSLDGGELTLTTSSSTWTFEPVE